MSNRSGSKVFSGFKLGDLELKNRIVMAPMTRARAGLERIPNEMMAEYYSERASSGLIITEATVISKQAIGWNQSPGIYNQEQVEGWKKVVEAVHAKGGKIFLQLWHCGRASHSSFFENGEKPVAPSAIKIDGDKIHTPNGKEDYEVPRALETEEVESIVNDYKNASIKAKEAGFDGVEIHGANGYLIDEFLQSKTNKRDDKYGGNKEKRYQFLKEIVEAILTVWDSTRVGVRLSPNGVFNSMGSKDFRETFLYVAGELDKYNLSYLHLLDGLAFGFHELGEPLTLAEFKKVYSGTLMGNCGYEFDSIQEQIDKDNAQLIAIGRPYISNPDLVERYKNEWPLNPPAPMETWYSFEKEGYLGYPTYSSKPEVQACS